MSLNLFDYDLSRVFMKLGADTHNESTNVTMLRRNSEMIPSIREIG